MMISIVKATSFYKPDHKLLQSLANEIKRLRKAKGLTIEEFADICDLHSKYIQTIERGKRNISISVFIQIADALEILPQNLLSKAMRHL